VSFKHITDFSDRYKLIYSNVESAYDVPWFIDMQRDGYEMYNYYNDEKYFEIIGHMAQRLKDCSLICENIAAAPKSKAGTKIEASILRGQQ